MRNRTIEENEAVLMPVLRQVGPNGLTIEQAREVLSIDGEQSKSFAKKVLEHLRTHGCVKVLVGKNGVCYVLIPGH